MVRRLLLVLALALVAPAAATASERPSDSRLDQQVRVAVEFWAAQTVTGCETGIRAHFFDALTTEDGHGEAAGHASTCEVWIDSGVADEYRHPRGGRGWRVISAEMECMLVTHEVGHALGLPHSESGIMAEDFQDVDTTAECSRWARRFVPRAVGYTTRRTLRSVRQR